MRGSPYPSSKRLLLFDSQLTQQCRPLYPNDRAIRGRCLEVIQEATVASRDSLLVLDDDIRRQLLGVQEWIHILQVRGENRSIGKDPRAKPWFKSLAYI